MLEAKSCVEVPAYWENFLWLEGLEILQQSVSTSSFTATCSAKMSLRQPLSLAAEDLLSLLASQAQVVDTGCLGTVGTAEEPPDEVVIITACNCPPPHHQPNMGLAF